MTDLDAFLAAIKANPADDTPRLVLADWLEERASPENGYAARAEFIRVQCEKVRMEPISRTWPGPKRKARKQANEFCDKYNLLCRREQELLDFHSHLWLFSLPPGHRPILPATIRKTFRRGFISWFRGSWEAWQTHGDAILGDERVPWLDDVEFADKWVPGLDEVELTSLEPLRSAGYTRRFIVTADSYESAITHPSIPRLHSFDPRGYAVSTISTGIEPVERQRAWEVEVEYSVPSVKSLEIRWPKVRKWTMPCEPPIPANLDVEFHSA